MYDTYLRFFLSVFFNNILKKMTEARVSTSKYTINMYLLADSVTNADAYMYFDFQFIDETLFTKILYFYQI